MKQLETEHYIFHYAEGSKAAQDIEVIAAHQEACAAHMCAVLGIDMAHKLHYFLCDTAEAVGNLYQGEPCNALACYPDKIYAVYNEHLQCIGFHEDAHLISFMCFEAKPNNPAIEEGFAMYFDRKWWGICNLDWVGYFLKSGSYIPIDKLLDAGAFYTVDCSVSYPTMGAFTEWLIATGGIKRYLAFYRKRDQVSAAMEFYGKTPAELDAAFTAYVRLFTTDAALEQQMAHLLASES